MEVTFSPGYAALELRIDKLYRRSSTFTIDEPATSSSSVSVYPGVHAEERSRDPEVVEIDSLQVAH